MSEVGYTNQQSCENDSILQWASWCEGEEGYLDDDNGNDNDSGNDSNED